jgi:hypothetical protein
MQLLSIVSKLHIVTLRLKMVNADIYWFSHCPSCGKEPDITNVVRINRLYEGVVSARDMHAARKRNRSER